MVSFHPLTLLAISVLKFQGQGASAANAEEWRTRSIYQVFTDRFARADSSTSAACSPGFEGYCGGNWRGIINKLDYIQGMGFTAVWISPIVAQVADQHRAYHGYTASNLNALNSHFGTASDLVALGKALHDRNMYLMVDIVVNHMGWDGTANTTDYDILNPFNSERFFHDICWINDYSNQTECWLGSSEFPLPDIDTTRDDVRDMFSSWIQSIVSLYSIDGLRIDTVKHVEKEFWPIFNSASGVFNLGEVADGNVDFVCPYQDVLDGVLDYPSFYQATLFFSNTSSTSDDFVKELEHLNSNCTDSTLLGQFSENHDQPRFASQNSDITLARNILTHTMLSDGIPIVYQGQESHFAGSMDPFNRETLWLPNTTLTPNAYKDPYSNSSPLYILISTLNTLRSLAHNSSTAYTTSNTKIVYSDNHSIAFQRGDSTFNTLTVLNNLGSEAKKYTVNIANTGLSAGLELLDVMTCKEMKVDKNGGVQVEVLKGEPVILYTHDSKRAKKVCYDSAAALSFTFGISKMGLTWLVLGWVLFF